MSIPRDRPVFQHPFSLTRDVAGRHNSCELRRGLTLVNDTRHRGEENVQLRLNILSSSKCGV